MKFSYLGQSSPIFKNNDLNFFKQQQIKNSQLLTKIPILEKFSMENDNTEEDSVSNVVLNDNDTQDEIPIDEHPLKQFNVNKMMKLNETYSAYKGSEIKVNNPPIAPYPFGPK